MPISAPAPPGVERPIVPKRDQEITGLRVRLYYWTRNPHVLFWMAFTILGVGLLLGKHFESTDRHERVRTMIERMREMAGLPADDPRETPVDLPSELLKPAPEFSRVIAALRQRDYNSPNGALEVYNAVRACSLPATEKNVALSYWTSLCSGLAEPGADLLFYAHQPEPPLYANELAGDFWAQHPKKTDRALQHYQRELTLRPDAPELRHKIVELHQEKENFAALAELQRDPAYESLFTPDARLQTAMRQKDWAAVWAPLVEMQKRNFGDPIPVILTCVAGAVWLVLAWQMAQVQGLFSFRLWAPLIAIPLGAVSTLPVLFLDVYQSEAWGLKHTGFSSRIASSLSPASVCGKSSASSSCSSRSSPSCCGAAIVSKCSSSPGASASGLPSRRTSATSAWRIPPTPSGGS
jgi:hypothetical protein